MLLPWCLCLELYLPEKLNVQHMNTSSHTAEGGKVAWYELQTHTVLPWKSTTVLVAQCVHGLDGGWSGLCKLAKEKTWTWGWGWDAKHLYMVDSWKSMLRVCDLQTKAVSWSHKNIRDKYTSYLVLLTAWNHWNKHVGQGSSYICVLQTGAIIMHFDPAQYHVWQASPPWCSSKM